MSRMAVNEVRKFINQIRPMKREKNFNLPLESPLPRHERGSISKGRSIRNPLGGQKKKVPLRRWINQMESMFLIQEIKFVQ